MVVRITTLRFGLRSGRLIVGRRFVPRVMNIRGIILARRVVSMVLERRFAFRLKDRIFTAIFIRLRVTRFPLRFLGRR